MAFALLYNYHDNTNQKKHKTRKGKQNAKINEKIRHLRNGYRKNFRRLRKRDGPLAQTLDRRRLRFSGKSEKQKKLSRNQRFRASLTRTGKPTLVDLQTGEGNGRK